MYIIISTKTPKEMEDLLNSKYIIKVLGNTWVTNGNVYQSFLGELTKEISAIKVEVPKSVPEATSLVPKSVPKKRKKKVIKEKKDVVPTISK